MTTRLPSRGLVALLAVPASCAALCGCGAATTTVTAKGEPRLTQGEASTQGASTATSTQSSTPAPQAQTAPSSSGGTAAPSTTRTASEPAFAEGAAAAQGASEAAAVVRSLGYTPRNLADYHEKQTLTVLVATRSSSRDGYGQKAFFFLDGRYIGTDTKEPSASVELLSQGDTEVTLAYPLYRRGDALGAPSAGRAVVHFQLNDGQLQPLGTIPPVDSPSVPSRR